MKIFEDSNASNFLVSLSIKSFMVEKKLLKDLDTENLVELYNSIQEAGNIIENKIAKIYNKKGGIDE